jgi:tRNA 2-thiocytidine biosynthesis protein TtcA
MSTPPTSVSAGPAAPGEADPPPRARQRAVYDKSPTWRRLLRTMNRSIASYGLIAPGDRILVAISGGKDSYTMLDLLWQARLRAPIEFTLVAVHLDQGQPGYDGSPLRQWLQHSGIPFEILHQDTYSVVKELVQEGGTYCAPCSRLRRGALYTAAERLGCNKLALGHHREDTLNTLLLNLLYAGKLQAMPAAYLTDDGRFSVIRPLIECAEADLAAHAAFAGYPILPCNLCGSQDGLKRKQVAELVSKLEQTIPDVRAVMLHALQNVRPSHLLDPEVAQAWAQRPPAVRPQQRIVLGPGRQLPVID